jgi:4-hydroxybenzoate polyprenyltransferase
MKLIRAFLQLIRWPNLVFIALSQLLFYYCIILPSLPVSYYLLPKHFSSALAYLLILASVLIAAGGYIINDYFDYNIDRVNKPDKMVVEKVIYRRHAILLHIIITSIGVLLSIYVAYYTNIIVAVSNIICTLLLWFYSTTFKRKLLSGNIIISLLTAWTFAVMYFATNTTTSINVDYTIAIQPALKKIYKFMVLYAGFAFIVSLIREVVKDMEDMEGDRKYHCKTMPIVWGVQATKVFVGVWMVVLIGALLVLQSYVVQLKWWFTIAYCMVLIIAPLCWLFFSFINAETTVHYHQLSAQIKWLMLSGILSLLFFTLYA